MCLPAYVIYILSWVKCPLINVNNPNVHIRKTKAKDLFSLLRRVILNYLYCS